MIVTPSYFLDCFEITPNALFSAFLVDSTTSKALLVFIDKSLLFLPTKPDILFLEGNPLFYQFPIQQIQRSLVSSHHHDSKLPFDEISCLPSSNGNHTIRLRQTQCIFKLVSF